MKITKYMEGQYIELVMDKIKDYARYSLYQVSKVVDGVKTPLYKECYSNHQMHELARNKYRIVQVESNERFNKRNII